MRGKIRRWADLLLGGYASIMFINQPVIGLVFLLASFWQPIAGLCGLMCVVNAIHIAKWWHLPCGAPLIYNSLLVGLSLGAAHTVNWQLVVLVLIGALMTATLSAFLTDWLWRIDHLPELSLSFIIVALTTGFAASTIESGGLAAHDALPVLIPAHLFGSPIDGFLIAMGSAFFSPYPLAGLLVFIGVLCASRYLAFLAMLGYATGSLVLWLLLGNGFEQLALWGGFNYTLTAMAVGGVFIVPSRRSPFLAIGGAIISAVLIVASRHVMVNFGLPTLALPFLLTTLTILTALRKRVAARSPRLVLERPALPDLNCERARLAIARGVAMDSVPLVPPFYGEWEIYQGFDGPYTHKDAWRYALDFYISSGPARNLSPRLEDYPCFGLPVLSPASGVVIRCADNLPDNAPGHVNVRENWGNYVMIRLASGLHVLLAHLRQGSLKVREGDYVTPGIPLATCGNSGRSPQPHLHLQVQIGSALGSPTRPFHLSCVVVRDIKTRQQKFRLAAVPNEKDGVRYPSYSSNLARALHLPNERQMVYRVKYPDTETWVEYSLLVRLTLFGQFQLEAPSGAMACFEETVGVLSFYERNDVVDPFFDVWLLALGLTPLSESVLEWSDKPTARLLPMTWRQRLAFILKYPLGAEVDSHYRRQWDESSPRFLQIGEHRLNLGWLGNITVTSEATLSFEYGCAELKVTAGEQIWHARLSALGQGVDGEDPVWVKVPGLAAQ